MPNEIEHKYLVKVDLWEKVIPERSIEIRQAYLLVEDEKTIRIRTAGSNGYITIKGKSIGTSRPEFEYEIPIKDANELINNFSSDLIVKTRHYITHENKKWEVDEFKGSNEGLIIAEIELKNENERYSLPNWVDVNVTFDTRYYNSQLSSKPFKSW